MLISDLPDTEYHARSEWSASQMVRVYEHSVHAALAAADMEQTPAMRAGSLVHALLEGERVEAVDPSAHPDTVAELRAMLPDAPASARKGDLLDMARESGITPRCDLPSDIVTPDQLAAASACVDAIDRKLRRMGLAWLRSGTPEVSLIGELAGLPVRCRPDMLCEQVDGSYVIVSWKTTSRGLTAPERWRRYYRWTRHYDLADALYIHIAEQVLSAPVRIIGVTVDRDDPHEDSVLVWEPSKKTIVSGQEKMMLAHQRIMLYRERSESGLPDTIMEV